MKTLLKNGLAVLCLSFILLSCKKEEEAPAPAKPSLSIETVKGPKKDDCGAFEWRVQFKLKNADDKKGWVVQKITFKKDIKNCDNSKNTDETLTFWEAWEVLVPRNTDSLWYLGNGTYDDMYRSPGHPDTKGEKDVKGEVKFFADQKLPDTFKKNNSDTYAGGLPSTKEKPAFWDNSDALKHDLNTTWICCDKTQTSTVTTTPEVKTPVKGKVPDRTQLDPIGRLIDEAIPAWTGGYDAPRSQQLRSVASELTTIPTAQLRESIGIYYRVFAGTEEEVDALSKVYLLLRVLYNLPVNADRSMVKVYGGWIHPSIDNPGITGFNLSWPVTATGIGPSAKILVTGVFGGYLGRAYDAVGELDYFNANFPRRVF